MKRERQPHCDIIGTAPNRKIYIHLFAKTPSVNEWSGKKSGQWIYAGIRKQWRQRLNLIRRYVRNIELQRAAIEVKRFTSTRKLDEENAAAGLKPIVDALLKRNNGIGLIKDDSPACMPHAPICHQIKVNGVEHEKSMIIIRELEE